MDANTSDDARFEFVTENGLIVVADERVLDVRRSNSGVLFDGLHELERFTTIPDNRAAMLQQVTR